MKASAYENKVADFAELHNLSYGEAERRLVAAERPPKKQRAISYSFSYRPKYNPLYPDVRRISYQQAVKRMKDAGKDTAADWDGPEVPEDACYDIADCLLFDREIFESTRRNYFNTHREYPSRQILKEIVADYVHDGLQKVRRAA